MEPSGELAMTKWQGSSHVMVTNRVGQLFTGTHTRSGVGKMADLAGSLTPFPSCPCAWLGPVSMETPVAPVL